MESKSSIDWLVEKIQQANPSFKFDALKRQAKAMHQKQAQLYATFVLKCVNNNLPPITFNDWINLENNEQQ